MTEFHAIHRTKIIHRAILAVAFLLGAANVALAFETLAHL